jgi:hypothetical protein
MVLFTVEGIETIREGGKGYGVESKFGEVGTNVDAIVTKAMPLPCQHSSLSLGKEIDLPS